MVVFNPSLSIDNRHELYWLYPSDPREGPAKDTVVEGEIVLQLPSAKKVKQIDVELIGLQRMSIRGELIKHTTLHRKVTLNPFDEFGILAPGTHRFSYVFVAPANTAPYERFGIAGPNITQRTEADKDIAAAHGGVGLGECRHRITATAYGVSRFGGDLVAEELLSLQANANPYGPAAGFNQLEEILHPSLGPLRAHLFTRYLLINGFLRLSLTLPAVPERCRIDDVSVILTQRASLQHPEQPSVKEECRPWSVPLWRLRNEENDVKGKGRANGSSVGGKQGPVELQKGEEFKLVRVVRLLNDNYIRPSTNDFTVTGIRMSHTLAVHVRYTTLWSESGNSVKEGETKELKIAFSAKIQSCDCGLENAQLPDYEASDSNILVSDVKGKGGPVAGGPATSSYARKWKVTYPRDCLCTRTNKDHLETVYGLSDYKEDEGGNAGTPGMERRTKWERDEEERAKRLEEAQLMRELGGDTVEDVMTELMR